MLGGGCTNMLKEYGGECNEVGDCHPICAELCAFRQVLHCPFCSALRFSQNPAAGASSAQLSNASPDQLTLQLSEEMGLCLDDLQLLDSEGRALITDHGLFLLVNLYGE